MIIGQGKHQNPLSSEAGNIKYKDQEELNFLDHDQ